MTTNRRAKHAARELAAQSGRSYTAARRELSESTWPRVFDLDSPHSDTSWPFAVDDAGRPVRLDVSETHHALIFGMTGSGKTNAARLIAFSALRSGRDVAIIDTVCGGANYEFAQRSALGVAGDLASAASLLTDVMTRAHQTLRLMHEHGVTRLDDLDDDVRPARMAVIIDSVADATTPSPYDDEDTARHKRIITDALRSIVREHRALGTSLVLVSQSAHAAALSEMPGGADLSMRSHRLLLGNSSLGQKAAALRHPFDAPTREEWHKGSGLFEANGSSAPTAVDVVYADQVTLTHALARQMANGIEVGMSVQVVGANKWWWKVGARDDRYLVLTRGSMYAVIDLAWNTTYNGVTPGAAVSSLDTLGGGWGDIDHPETILAALHSGEHELSHRRVAAVARLNVR